MVFWGVVGAYCKPSDGSLASLLGETAVLYATTTVRGPEYGDK